MKDEQSQSPGYFKGKYNEMILILEMSQERNSLMIRIKNQETLECFENVIDLPYLQDHQQISFIFQSPDEILKYISENFDNISISKNGEIQFTIQIMSGKKGKTIVLKTDKKKMNMVEQLDLKIEFLKDEFQEKLDLKQERIKALEQSNATLIQHIFLLNKERQRTKILKDISVNLANPHAKQFMTYIIGNTLIVKRNTDANAWYNFILNQEICVGAKAEYKVKILNNPEKNIFFGFGTRNVFGVSSCQNTEIMLFSCSGQLLEGGPSQNISLKFDKGDILTCSANLLTNKACWNKNRQYEITIDIPEKMKGKQLYFVAYSCYPTDQFQIIFEQ